MLSRFRLDLATAADDGHQRQMHEDRLTTTKLHADLTDRLEERQGLDVTDRAADLDHADIGIAGA